MSSCLSSSTTKTAYRVPIELLKKFRPFSLMGFSDFTTQSSKMHGTSPSLMDRPHFSEREKSIYTILTIDRWESLNHMEYKLATLRPVHGRLVLKFHLPTLKK
ncbi:hypothetical protein SLA2020_057900 [Shorea laevis]